MVQKNTYDRAGRLVRQMDSVGSRIEYTYKLAGDRVFFQTAGGAAQELVYDAQGNIIKYMSGYWNLCFRIDFHIQQTGRFSWKMEYIGRKFTDLEKYSRKEAR